MNIAAMEDIIEAFGAGEFVIVLDDHERENEGDLIIAADQVTEEKIAFMVRHTSGVICMPVEGSRLDDLRLPMMVSEPTERHRTAFTVSVDVGEGTTTGISAADRTATIKAIIDPTTRPEDLNRPGHIFPLRYADGGVLRRAGHTEAAVDLARFAGRYPAGVLCELVNDSDGSMMRGDDIERFAKEHGLLIVTIAEIIAYRRRSEKLVRLVAEAPNLPTRHGDWKVYGYESLVDGRENLVLVMGEVAGEEDVLVRAHSECLTGDTLGSLRCDCGFQLDRAMEIIAEEGKGVILYIRGHEGRGIGLMHKLTAYALQDQGRDTYQANVELGFPADARDYGVGAQILFDLGLTSIRLLTNNPQKRAGIEGYGLSITDTIPLQTKPTEQNRRYLETKAQRMGHALDIGPEVEPEAEQV